MGQGSGVQWLWNRPVRPADQTWSKASAWSNDLVKRSGGGGLLGFGSDISAAHVSAGSRGALGTGARLLRGVAGETFGKDSLAYTVADRTMRFADVAQGTMLATSASGKTIAGSRINKGKGAAMVAQATGNLIGGEKGDQIAGVGLGASQALGYKGYGVSGIATGVTGALYGASILMRDKKSVEAMQAPFMGSLVSKIALNDASRAVQSYKGNAIIKAPMGRFGAATKRATVKTLSKAAVGRSAMRVSGAVGAKMAAHAGTRALASLGPLGLAVRGYSAAQGVNHAFHGRWKEAAWSAGDTLLFGTGSAKLVVAAGKQAVDCAKDAANCARQVKDFSIRAGQAIGRGVQKGYSAAQDCMRSGNRAQCARDIAQWGGDAARRGADWTRGKAGQVSQAVKEGTRKTVAWTGDKLKKGLSATSNAVSNTYGSAKSKIRGLGTAIGDNSKRLWSGIKSI